MGGKVPLLPLPPPEERRKLRDQMGITREEAAADLGVTVRTLLRWEWGRSEPHAENHRRYRELLETWRKSVDHYL